MNQNQSINNHMESVHQVVLDTIQEHNRVYPNDMKAVYEEPEDEYDPLVYTEFAKEIFENTVFITSL